MPTRPPVRDHSCAARTQCRCASARCLGPTRWRSRSCCAASVRRSPGAAGGGRTIPSRRSITTTSRRPCSPRALAPPRPLWPAVTRALRAAGLTAYAADTGALLASTRTGRRRRGALRRAPGTYRAADGAGLLLRADHAARARPPRAFRRWRAGPRQPRTGAGAAAAGGARGSGRRRQWAGTRRSGARL